MDAALIVVTAGPWLADGVPTMEWVSTLVAGLLMIALAIPRGPKRESYGGWDRWVF